MDFNNNPEDFPQLPRRSAQSYFLNQPNTDSRFNITVPEEFKPKTLEEVDRLYKMGLIDRAAADQYEMSISNNIPPLESENTTGTTQNTVQGNTTPWQPPLFNMAGSDLSTELYSLGMQLGRKPGAEGRNLGIASSAGSALLGATRDLLSGYGMTKSSNRFEDFYKEQLGKINYTPASQTQNENYTGGLPTGEQGGTFRVMADGGRFGNNSQPFDLVPYQGLTGAQIAQLTPEEKVKIREHYYNQTLPQNSYRDPNKYSYKLKEEELANYIKQEQAKDPYVFEATGLPSQMYVGMSNGKPDYTNFFPIYAKPSIQTIATAPVASQPATQPKATTANPVMLDPNTGQALPHSPMYEGQQIPVQYSSTLERDYNTPEAKAKRAEQAQRIAQNKELIKTMTPEQLEEAKKLRMTPAQYLQSIGQPIMEDGGTFPGPGDPPTKEQIYQATLDYINANPITTKKGEPLKFDNLQPISGYAAPKLIGEDLLVPGVRTFKKGEYQVAPMPEGYIGLPVYIVNGKPIVADQKFNQEYYKMYKDPKLLGKDELYPIYGQGYPYKEQMEDGGRFSGNFDVNRQQEEEDKQEERLPLPEVLTDQYIQGLPEDSKIEPNVELEGDEYVQFPDELKTTQKVVGPSHKEGGTDMLIPDGTKVISKKRTLTKAQVKQIEKEYDLKVSTETSYSEVIDMYVKKIGLNKINKQQEELYTELEKQLKKDGVDPKTLEVNKRYIASKIAKLETEKQPLEADKATFFDKVFEMQEQAKPVDKKEENKVFEDGGISYQNFENTIKKLGIDREKALQYLREGGVVKKENPVYEGGGEIFVTKESSLPTGADLNDKQKEELLKYYEKHNPAVSKALKSGGLKWESVVLNKGLVDDLEAKGFEGIVTGHQGTDKESKLLKNAPTYGNMTEARVQNFVLKDFFEQKYGKPFSEATPAEIKKLQLDYNEALTKQGIPYQSGVNPNEVSDGNFGNRTSSYLRSVVQVSGNKEGRIDVDRILNLPADQLQKALDEYGLKASDLEPYKNAAYKYIDIVPGTPSNNIPPAEAPLDASIPTPKGKLRDFVDITNRKVETPHAYYTPDQSVLPPSGLEVGLMVDNRFQRIDPVRIGIDQAIQETNNARVFAQDMLETAPISQRISAMASVFANSQEGLNKSIVETNRINAQNQASAELYNAGRADAENIARGNNLLSYEQRAFQAKAITEEEIRNYFDRNKTVALNNFANQQRLNLLDQMAPNYDINFMGTGVNFNPAYDWQVSQNPNTQRFSTEEEKQLDVNEKNRIFEEFMNYYNNKKTNG